MGTAEWGGFKGLRPTLARFYLKISPAFPTAYVGKKNKFQRSKEEYEDECHGGFLKWFTSRIDLRCARVLDLGCGYGGRTTRYKELGASFVCGVEVNEKIARECRNFALSRGAELASVAGYGEALPFRDGSFDTILCYDVLEHVGSIGLVLDECLRVLQPGGKLWAVFPPFYHPTGAHLEGFVSKMPYANVLFSPSVLRAAVESILAERNDGYRPMALRPGDALWTLNGATIQSFRQELKKRTFRETRVELAPLFSPMNHKWYDWRMKYYAFLFAPLAAVPYLNEYFVHRIVCELTR